MANNSISRRLKRNLSLRATTYGVRNWLILGIIGLFLALALPTLPFSVVTIFHILGIASIGVAIYAGVKRIWSLTHRSGSSVLGDRVSGWLSHGRNFIQLSLGILLTLVMVGLLVCMSPNIYSLVSVAPDLQPLLEVVHHCLSFLSDGFSNLYGGVISAVASQTLASIFLLFTTLTAYHTFCGFVKVIWGIENNENSSTEEDIKIKEEVNNNLESETEKQFSFNEGKQTNKSRQNTPSKEGAHDIDINSPAAKYNHTPSAGEKTPQSFLDSPQAKYNNTPANSNKKARKISKLNQPNFERQDQSESEKQSRSDYSRSEKERYSFSS